MNESDYIVTIAQLPTPTPRPPVVATAPVDFDTDAINTGIAYEIVGAWQKGDEFGVTEPLQIALLLLIVIGGIGLIMRGLRSINDV